MNKLIILSVITFGLLFQACSRKEKETKITEERIAVKTIQSDASHRLRRQSIRRIWKIRIELYLPVEQ